MFDNTQGTLESVPFAIRSFYHQEVRSEATGAQVSEDYTYIDSEGQEQTGTRLVDEYQDVSYLVMNSRHDLKSWADVESAKAHGTYDAVCHFIEKASESELWLFHDSYLAWLDGEPVLDDEAFLTPNEDGDNPSFNESWFKAAHDAWSSSEPVKVVTNPGLVLAKYHEDLAKHDKEVLINANIELNGATWQVDKTARDNINEQVNAAARNNLPLSTAKNWILADNTIRETTIGELCDVLDAYATRQNNVVSAYAIWRSSDLSTRFTV
ncbi:hypothetical protein [Vibrio fluvialis]|uniref:DUF4376 domain-containing protein n=1 Tax=Vibrio fluvialis TaxID=676 RepID=UPI003999B0C6